MKMLSTIKSLTCIFIFSINFSQLSSQPLNNKGKFLLSLDKTFLDTTKIVAKEICCSHSFTLVNNVFNTNEKAVKFTVFDTDHIVNSGVRSEFSFRRESKVKVDRWYGFDIYLPSDYAIDTAPEALAQWHDIPDFDRGENWRSPPISLWAQKKHWYLHILWSSDTVNTNKTAHTEIYDLGKYTKNEWTTWIFHIKFSWEADGQLEIWQQHKKIFNKNGPNAYNDKVGEYFKIGIYKWVWNNAASRKTSLTHKREVYYKNIKLGNESQNYQTFSSP